MLTKNFWSLLCGGGKNPNYQSANMVKVITIRKSNTNQNASSGGIGQILANNCTVITENNLEYLKGSDSRYKYTFYRFCNFNDNKNLSDSQIYTLDGDIGVGTYNSSGQFRTIRSETTNHITGIKINFSYANRTGNDIVFNTIKIVNYGGNDSNGYSDHNNQYNHVVAIVQLNETVTIKPEETYTFEYNIDNIFEDIPDTIV